MLDNKGQIPLYIQIKNSLKEQIQDGQYKSGQKIPTEPELGEIFQVSRVTVRKAIEDLVNEGYLIKKQGKGTFVNHKTLKRKMSLILGFSASCREAGLEPSSQVLKVEVIDAPQSVAEKLGLTPSDKVIYIQRKRCADGVPIFLENNYYDYKRFSFLLDEDLEESVYDICAKHGIHPAKRGKNSMFEIVTANRFLASLLGVSVGTPFFYMDVVIQEEDGTPVHVGHQYYLGEYYKFDM
ncbi:TPA: GntR family transcriptional regulator [Streptococcus suis]|nr:GntR family transcriptional regulator [Streptococcus suis]